MKRCFTFSLILICFVSFCKSQDYGFRYLGQTEPNETPKVFQLPVMDGVAAERIAVSSDYKELYFTEIHPSNNTRHIVKQYRFNGSIWNGPYVLFDGYNEYGPSLSIDNSKLFINCDYCKRTETGWSQPVRFLNNKVIHYLQETDKGNYYFLSFINDSTTDIYKMIVTGKDTTLQAFGLNMKSKVQNDYYIATDESYLLVSLNKSEIKCFGGKDIFIRFRTKTGWSKPINLGNEINTNDAFTRFGMSLTPDKKFMFYSQVDPNGVHVFWVKVDDLFKRLREQAFSIE